MNILKKEGKLFVSNEAVSCFEKLPIGVYMLDQDPRTSEFFLIEKETFTLPKKLYGDFACVDRWLTAYNSAEKNMGIILSGLKGSGKTITAEKLCLDSKMPVIIISNAFSGVNFINFITCPVIQNSIIFIDEYEKIYKADFRDVEKDILSIMDGAYKTRLMFLLTCNNFTISEYLINRPSRIKYRKDYDNLEPEIVEAVIEDLLDNKDNKQSIYEFFGKIGIVTFDLLVTVIKEMNLFKENAIECGKHLNLQVSSNHYDVYEIINDKEYPCYSIQSTLDSDIRIERKMDHYKSLNKVVSRPVSSETDEDDLYEEPKYSYEIEIEKTDMQLDKVSSSIIMLTDTKDGFVFKLIKKPISKLVF